MNVKESAMSDNEIKLITPEDDYSAYYRHHLFLAIHDDYADFPEKVHAYEKIVARKIALGLKRNQIAGFKEAWIDPTNDGRPFKGRNIANYLKGMKSSHELHACLDVYMKLTKPVVARGFMLEYYLDRLGLVLSEFSNPKQLDPKTPTINGLFQNSSIAGEIQYIHINAMEGRHFAVCHFIRELESQSHNSPADILIDHCMQINKGVLMPHGDQYSFVMRSIDTHELFLGFARKAGDDICAHRATLDGEMLTHTFNPVDKPHIELVVRQSSFEDEEIN